MAFLSECFRVLLLSLFCLKIAIAYTCSNVGPTPVFYDPSCSAGEWLGCNADGQGQNCRFCWAAPSKCRFISTTLSPAICHPVDGQPAFLDPSCSTCNAGGQNLECRLCGSDTGVTCPSYVAVPNCTYAVYRLIPCFPPPLYYCPSSGACWDTPFDCPDLCLMTVDPPYPPRPVSTNSFTPSSQLTPQTVVCGAQAVVPQPPCAVQPNDPSWPFRAAREAQCTANQWWCPNGTAFVPSKYQCGAPLEGNNSLCPIDVLQAQACEVSQPYQAPVWAPQPKTGSSYCDTTKCTCDNLKTEAECFGCCTWNETDSTCKPFYDVGLGPGCRLAAPRFNWIITTCDTMGGIEFGASCIQNPFSALDVRYVATYQLSKTSNGAFVWQILPDSSINTNGEAKYVDWSALPTEHTGTGVVRSCSGGGGEWNAAYFPYKVSGGTPPAWMFVISYERFDNVALFMLNQRTLNGGPDIPTCSDMTNCWLEVSAGEIDFLEQPNQFPDPRERTEKAWWTYRATSYNSQNRCWACSFGYANGSLNLAGCGGANATSFYNAYEEKDDQKPHIWAIVVDARGSTIYKDPVWPGITQNCAADQLVNLHPQQPEQNQPCSDPTKSCAMYLPGCVTEMSPQMTQITGGDYTRIPTCYFLNAGAHVSCTENWWNLLMDTGQWPIPEPEYWDPDNA